MIIDLEPILSGKKDEIIINTNLDIPSNLLEKSSICGLKEVKFVGKIKRILDSINIIGQLEGIMLLKDDITINDVEYKFNSEIEEELTEEITDSKVDLMNYLWQFIQVEIPSKITTNNKIENIEGRGWRFISGDESNKNYAFKDLDKLINERR